MRHEHTSLHCSRNPDIPLLSLSQDGYPTWAGLILLQHYQTLERVTQLLTGGNLYRLGLELGEPHDFFVAQNDEILRRKNQTWCCFKLRDYDRHFLQPSDEQAQAREDYLICCQLCKFGNTVSANFDKSVSDPPSF